MTDDPNEPGSRVLDTTHDHDVQGYGGGHVQARHGRVNGWLLLVYLVMFVWALYYGWKYWGGLGPGLI
jgi:hypothetical protein